MIFHRKNINLVKSPVMLQKDQLLKFYESLTSKLEHKLELSHLQYHDLWLALKKIQALAMTKAEIGSSIAGSSLNEIISICDQF